MKPPTTLSLGLLTDRYTRNARLYPSLFLVAPAALCAFCLVSVELPLLKSIAAALAACGGSYFLSQFARDPGKAQEPILFEKWGGMPSVSILRHRDTRIDPITKARYHKQLQTRVKGTKIIAPEVELEKPHEADQLYSAWSTYLRDNTRDHSKYPLIFDELVSYGYRRNLLGLKPLGMALCVLSVLAAAVMAGLQMRDHGVIESRVYAAIAIPLVFLLLWVFRITPSWVRLVADAYAQRLIEGTDTVGDGISKAKNPKSTSVD